MWVKAGDAQASGCEEDRKESQASPAGRGEQGSSCPRSQNLLQFSSSLPSGQSSKPLQRKRPMMQWMPLAHGKKVGPHFDFALAAGGKETQRAVSGDGVLWPQPPYPTHPECAKESFRFSMKSPRECNHPTTTCQTPNQHGHLQAAFSRAANHTASKVLTGTWEKAQAVRCLLHKHEDLILNPRNYTET